MSVSLVDIATKSRLRPGNTSPGEGAWGAKGTHSLTDKGAPPSHSCLLCVNARVLSTNDRYVGRNVAAVSDTYTFLHCSMCFAALHFPRDPRREQACADVGPFLSLRRYAAQGPGCELRQNSRVDPASHLRCGDTMLTEPVTTQPAVAYSI